MNTSDSSSVDMSDDAENRTSLIHCAMDGEAAEYMVVYGSGAERVISVVVLMLVWLVTVVGQTSVIVTILKSKNLHTPHFMIILSCCLGDLIMVCSVFFMAAHYLASCIPLRMCWAGSILHVAIGFGMAGLTGFMSLERYAFFCHPLRYESICNTRIVVLINLGMFAIPLIYFGIRELLTTRSRIFYSSVLACLPLESNINTTVNVVCFILPTSGITVFSTWKIWRLSISGSVAPAVPSAQQDHSVQRLPVRQAKKVLRMILMVSGTFWATYLPSVVIIASIFSEDMRDVDSRRHFTKAISMRIASFLFMYASSLLNPFIYYYSRRDLRQAFYTLCGKHTQAVDPSN